MEPGKQSRTILVVDDDCAIYRLVKVFLELEGYTVLTADSAESAMRLYQDHQSAVALMLTDVEMPNASGLELADRVLQVEPGLKILFMSAIGGARHGFECIVKPFTQAQLVGSVGDALVAQSHA